MDYWALWNGEGAALVLGGTLLATALGSGKAELKAAVSATIGLLRKPFDYAAVRGEIAHEVEEMRHSGVLRARPCQSSDSEIARITDALVHDRSLASLVAEHQRCRRERSELRETAMRPIRLAAEMAPVFGMAGTLFSLTQMDLGGADNMLLVNSIGMAILTTLYGILLAHILFNPLARLIERRGEREEAERQRLIDWLATQLQGSCPPSRGRVVLEQVG